jgi:hypothetical protein
MPPNCPHVRTIDRLWAVVVLDTDGSEKVVAAANGELVGTCLECHGDQLELMAERVGASIGLPVQIVRYERVAIEQVLTGPRSGLN